MEPADPINYAGAMPASKHILIQEGLGDQTVPNNAYSGPAATTAPFNQKTVVRHYGFGTATGTVSIGPVNVPATGCTSTSGCITS